MKSFFKSALALHYAHQAENLRVASILLQCLLVGLLCQVPVLTTFVMADKTIMDLSTRMVFGPLNAMVWLSMLSALFLLMRGKLNAARCLTVACTTIGVTVAVALTGGYPRSPALPVILVPTTFAFLLFGAKGGVRIAIFSATACLIQWVLSGLNLVTLPDLSSKANPTLDLTIVRLIAFAVFCLALYVYERSNAKFRNELAREREQLALLAMQDSVTGLANSRLFGQRLDRACEEALAKGEEIAVVFLDLDGFKNVNDLYGHSVGDKLLRRVAQIILANVPPTATVARLGGDEYALLLRNAETAELVTQLRRKLDFALQQSVRIGDIELHIRASIGSASFPSQVENKERLMEMADLAMYRQKRRNRLKMMRGTPAESDVADAIVQYAG